MQRRTAPLQVSLFALSRNGLRRRGRHLEPPRRLNARRSRCARWHRPGRHRPRRRSCRPAVPGARPLRATGRANGPGVPGPAGPGVAARDPGMPPTGLPPASALHEQRAGPAAAAPADQRRAGQHRPGPVPRPGRAEDHRAGRRRGARLPRRRRRAAGARPRLAAAHRLRRAGRPLGGHHRAADAVDLRTNDAGLPADLHQGASAAAFREPLDRRAGARLRGLFAGRPTFETGPRRSITAMLQSPYLLYRRELGKPDPGQAGAVPAHPPRGGQQPVVPAHPGPPDDAAGPGGGRRPALHAAADRRPGRAPAADAARAQDPGHLRGRLAGSRAGRDRWSRTTSVFPFPDELREDMVRETAALVRRASSTATAR